MTDKGLDKSKMVEGLRRLEEKALDELVHQFSRPLFGVILNYTRNPADAEEILQDTLLKIIRKIDTLRDEKQIVPWMKRIAINNSIMWLRKNRVRKERQVDLAPFLPHFSEDGQHRQPIVDWGLDPEEAILNKELARRLYDAVHELPFGYRAPLVLRDIEGHSIREISSLLGLKEATTKTRIHRARLFLREKLGQYLEG